jgi:Flp pilus assembly protein TadD
MHPLFENIKGWLIEQLTGKPPAAAPAQATAAQDQIGHDHAQSIVPFDENLLERSRTQWQFGDWDSLAKLDRDTLQHHPDRARLALLAAAGRLQTGQGAEARQYIRLAQDWGVSKQLLTRILAAGVHNSLGRAAAAVGENSRALQHFQSAVATGAPGSEARLLAQARISYQYQQLGLPPAHIKAQPNAVLASTNFIDQSVS